MNEAWITHTGRYVEVYGDKFFDGHEDFVRYYFQRYYGKRVNDPYDSAYKKGWIRLTGHNYICAGNNVSKKVIRALYNKIKNSGMEFRVFVGVDEDSLLVRATPKQVYNNLMRKFHP